MTQYLDRHGTEIRHGDRLRESTGHEWTIINTDSHFPQDLCDQVVIAREDGSLVFRYKGGEDVRVGDIYVYGKWKAADGTARVTEELLAHMRYAKEWQRCTLLRRADSPRELSSTALVAERADPIRCSQCRHPLTFPKSIGLGLCVDCRTAGDEKADRDFNYGEGKSEAPMNVAELLCQTPGCAKPRMTGEVRCRWCKAEIDRSKHYGDAIESICRALAGPTRGQARSEQYAAFRLAIDEELAKEPAFRAVTDYMPAKDEFVLWLTMPIVGERRYSMRANLGEWKYWITATFTAAKGVVCEHAGARVLGKERP